VRKRFDEKFSPANVLISTGHTIALSKRLSDTSVKKSKLTDNSIIRLSDSVIFAYINNTPFLARWRRHCGIVFIKEDWAELVFLKLNKPSFPEELVTSGISFANIYHLFLFGFIVISDSGNGKCINTDELPTIDINFGGYYNNMKWDGYYDAN
jgi:hypothetical protein